MTLANEGEWDRGVRIPGGIALLYAGWSPFAASPVGVVLMIGELIALATGTIGWCPAYTACGVSTRRAAASHCPHCEPHRRV